MLAAFQKLHVDSECVYELSAERCFHRTLAYRVVSLCSHPLHPRSCLQPLLFAPFPRTLCSSDGYPGSKKEAEREERQNDSPSKVSNEGRRSVRGATCVFLCPIASEARALNTTGLLMWTASEPWLCTDP